MAKKSSKTEIVDIDLSEEIHMKEVQKEPVKEVNNTPERHETRHKGVPSCLRKERVVFRSPFFSAMLINETYTSSKLTALQTLRALEKKLPFSRAL